MPYFWSKDSPDLLQKWLSWSLIMVPSTPNLQKNVRSHKLHNNFTLISSGGLSFNPLGDIINNK